MNRLENEMTSVVTVVVFIFCLYSAYNIDVHLAAKKYCISKHYFVMLYKYHTCQWLQFWNKFYNLSATNLSMISFITE